MSKRKDGQAFLWTGKIERMDWNSNVVNATSLSLSPSFCISLSHTHTHTLTYTHTHTHTLTYTHTHTHTHTLSLSFLPCISLIQSDINIIFLSFNHFIPLSSFSCQSSLRYLQDVSLCFLEFSPVLLRVTFH